MYFKSRFQFVAGGSGAEKDDSAGAPRDLKRKRESSNYTSIATIHSNSPDQTLRQFQTEFGVGIQRVDGSGQLEPFRVSQGVIVESKCQEWS